MNNQSLKYIKNGSIDYYYGLKIETNLSYEKLCSSISDKIDKTIYEYKKYIHKYFQKSIDESIRENGLEKDLHVKDIDKAQIDGMISDISELNGEITNLEIDSADNKLRITPITIVDNFFNMMDDELHYDYFFSKQYYSESYVSSQTRFVLPPFKIELQNGSCKLLTAMLIVFTNSTAVLRLTLSIDDMDSKSIMSDTIDDYIVAAKPIYGFEADLKDNSIGAIQDCYCRYISEIKKVKAVCLYKKIVNIILANHSGMFDDIKNVPNEIKEEIYKISAAPVQERESIAYIQEYTTLFEENVFFFNGIGYILSSMGKCVSIVDNTVVDFVKKTFEEEEVFNKIINDLRRNVEFSIIIMCLKNINDSDSFYKKGQCKTNLSKVKNEYNKNKIYISLLQDGVYGSVRELTSKFEKNMTFFLDKKNVEDRMNALNCILEEEQSKRTLQLQNVLSIVGLIFTIIFGLPAINETLMHIRKLCFFIADDLPVLSIDNVSFVIWIILSLGMCVFVFCKSKIKKYD